MIESRGIAVRQEDLTAAKMAASRRLPRGGALVCLLGVAGAGKSTQAAALADVLRSPGVDAVHTPARWDPHPLLSAGLSQRPPRPSSPAEASHPPPPGRRGSPTCRQRLWKSLVLMDHARQILPRVRIPLLMGRTIVADRYVYDTLVDLALALGCPPEDLLGDLLLGLFPRPDLVILMDLAPQTPTAGKGDDALTERLTERRTLYLRLGEALGSKPVDADLSPSRVHAEIRTQVWRQLGF